MRAVEVPSFGEPEVMRVINVPAPTITDNHQILIRLYAAGINPVEAVIRSGMLFLKPSLPYIPGSDGAGIVEEVGNEVTKYKKGDRVFVFLRNIASKAGTYAEFVISDEESTFPLSSNLSFSQGAAIGIPYFTAYYSLIQKGNAMPSETVLVHGASGACGLAAVQLARANGLTVIGTAGSSEGLKLVKENGAHHVFNHREPGYTEKILEATGGKGVDIIAEMVAHINLAEDLTLIAPKGRILVVGCRGEIKINPLLLMMKESSVMGIMLIAADDKEWKQLGNAIAAGMEQGWLKPVIDREYHLEDVVQAHKDIMDHPGAKGKLTLAIAN